MTLSANFRVVAPFEHFQWRYMSFGLRNAPATFSCLVSKLLIGLDTFCAAYLDDIIIFSDTWEEHLSHLRTVLSRIRAANLTLSPTKCCCLLYTSDAADE